MRWRCLTAGLVLMLCACPVAAQRLEVADVVFAGLATTNTALAVYDARATVRCVERWPGECVEANVLFNAIAVSKGIRSAMVVKVGADVAITGFTTWAMHRWRDKKWVIVASYAVNTALKGLVIRHNNRVMERLGR